jgi:3-phenylpropionate/cinnamic acid dioxygenase small subunit
LSPHDITAVQPARSRHATGLPSELVFHLQAGREAAAQIGVIEFASLLRHTETQFKRVLPETGRICVGLGENHEEADAMMSLQEMSDRLEIQDLFARYSFAIDDRNFDALDEVFTSDASIDYTETGGARGTVAQIKKWLPTAMERFPKFQHMVATTELKLEGDRAAARTILFNPMVHRADDGREQVFFIGLWYRDTLIRTAVGWRIAERYEEMAYSHNAPPMEPVPAIASVG